MNYQELHKDKIQEVPGGTLCQVFGDKEKASCSVALVHMNENSNGVRHYHNDITEIYLFSKGKGSININGNINEINDGDCYIIPPNNIHYIESNEEMDFACICTPPWIESKEFAVNEEIQGENINKTEITGTLQKLSDKENHEIRLYETANEFIPSDNMKNYKRVYYFITGEGIFKIDDKEYPIKPNICYEVNKETNEIIIPNTELKFVVVCDDLK